MAIVVVEQPQEQQQQQPHRPDQMVVQVLLEQEQQQQQQQQQHQVSSSRRGGRRRGGRRRANRGANGANSNSNSHHQRHNHHQHNKKATTISDFLFLKDGVDTGDDNETCTTCSWDGSESSSDDSSSLSSSPYSTQRRRRPQHRPLLHVTPVSLEEQRRYVALDCELVGVGLDGRKSMVARVTLVGWNGETIWDEFIQPTEEVTDYRTYVSGITPDDLLPRNAKFTFQQCQEHLRDMLSDKVLVGHALKNDLRALQITHPWQRTRDTGRYEPFMKTRDSSLPSPPPSSSVLWPRKLRELVQEKLDREIQVVGRPHSSYEDAVAAMDLYKLVRTKWEKVMDYKIERTRQIELERQQKQL